MVTLTDISKMIDHSLLHPAMTDKELIDGCLTAVKYNTASVCIKPYAVTEAVKLLNNTSTVVCAVIGFPHGNSHTDIKVEETIRACEDGAAEIDMVINIGKALSGEFGYVRDEIKAINDSCISHGAILKVIFENDFLTDDVILSLCRIANEVKPAFIKTSTGYGFVKTDNGFYTYAGATDHHLKLMRANTDSSIAIKAAGGVRTLKDLLKVRSVGVTRIGATATAAIVEEAKKLLENGIDLKQYVE